MDILRHISHDRVGAAPQTVLQCSVGHHTEILCLINDHMAGLPDAVCLLNTFVQIGQSRQIIHIIRSFCEGNRLSLLCLVSQKFPVKFKNGIFPGVLSKVLTAETEQFFFLLCRTDHVFSHQFIFQLSHQDLIQGIDLTLHGKLGILLQIAADRLRG